MCCTQVAQGLMYVLHTGHAGVNVCAAHKQVAQGLMYVQYTGRPGVNVCADHSGVKWDTLTNVSAYLANMLLWETTAVLHVLQNLKPKEDYSQRIWHRALGNIMERKASAKDHTSWGGGALLGPHLLAQQNHCTLHVQTPTEMDS